MRRLATLTALVLLVAAAPAAAAQGDTLSDGSTVGADGLGHFPGERPATARVVVSFAAIAEHYWRSRGLTPCERPQLLEADALGYDVEGLGEPDSCRVWVWASDVALAQAEHFDPDITPSSDSDREALCAVIVHEYGHLSRYRDESNLEDPDHSSDPDSIMAATTTAMPWDCHAWRLAQDRPAKRAYARRQARKRAARLKARRAARARRAHR